MKTLVLANDETIAPDFVRELKRRKHEVFTVSTFDEAWSAYTRHSPEIVIATALDDDALALCRHVSARSAELTVTILMVVKSEKGERLPEVIAAGADDYVLSPMEPERMRIRLDLAEKRVREKISRFAVEAELGARERQQAAVSQMGLSALDGAGPEQMMERAVRVVSEGLGVELAKISSFRMALKGCFCAPASGGNEVGSERSPSNRDAAPRRAIRFLPASRSSSRI